MDQKNELSSGWAVGSYTSTAFHFEHVLLSKAEEKLQTAEELHVVETINTTLVDGRDPAEVHRNLYFAFTLNDAVGLAAQIVIASIEVAEMVVAIRPATDAEMDQFYAADNWFQQKRPAGLSDEFVGGLVK